MICIWNRIQEQQLSLGAAVTKEIESFTQKIELDQIKEKQKPKQQKMYARAHDHFCTWSHTQTHMTIWFVNKKGIT